MDNSECLIIKNGVVTRGDRDALAVVVPDGVTEIGMYAFSGCASLVEITLPESVKRIGDGAFSGCVKLEHFAIPSSVTEIGCGAFYNCTSLKTAFIPKSVQTVYDDAFSKCESVEIYAEGEPTKGFADRTEYLSPSRTYDGETQEIQHKWNPLSRPVHTFVSRAEYEDIVRSFDK